MADLSQSPVDPWHKRHLWQITPVRDLCYFAIFVFLLWFGYWLQAIFTPVLIGLVLAYLFHPMITFCQRRWSMPRPLTISIIIAALFVGCVLFVLWLGPKFVKQLVDFVSAAPGYVHHLAQQWNIDMGQVEKELNAWSDNFHKKPGTYLMSMAKVILGGTGGAISVIGQVFSTATYLLITALLIPVYFFFFAWSFDPMVRSFEIYLPASNRSKWLGIIASMDQVVSNYVRCRVVIALILGVMFSIGWMLAGVPYWLLLGMASGLLSIIPYASIVGLPIAVVLMWLKVTSGVDAPGFELWAVIVWPSVVYIIVQAIDGGILTPLIQGQSLNMSVVTILIVMFVGGAVGGLYGLILCIPVAACVKILLNEVYLPQLRQWAAEN